MQRMRNETDINLSNLIEKFEIRRSFYDQGLWGYCADEGATKLIHDIDILLNITNDNNSKGTPMTICNRDELLECHPTFKKCQCIVDVRDFRNVVSEYWEDEEETNTRETKGKSLGRDGCVLKAGSNCPVANESPFLCVPGTNCLTMNGHKPCTLNNVVSSVLSSPSRSKRSANRRYSFIKDTYPTIHCQCYGYESPRA
ncbi:unnamed protein product [Orchesella dallaii]|uniref:Uncharacterized protein n=1 Tax=Orchesella dallaii TaxID=48710 RepID=A0ABP1Q9H5_9HEXA